MAAARDSSGENEGVDTYVDVGVRLSGNVSVGLRDRQLPEDRSLHDVSLWGRFDLSDYTTSQVIPYTRLGFGHLILDMGGTAPDVSEATWWLAGGIEMKQSDLFSFFSEAEGIWYQSSEHIDELGLRLGGLFRF